MNLRFQCLTATTLARVASLVSLFAIMAAAPLQNDALAALSPVAALTPLSQGAVRSQAAPPYEAPTLPSDWALPTPIVDETLKATSLPAVLGDAGPLAPFTVGADPALVRESLVSTMLRFGSMSYVPYVWGGRTIGSQAECDSCKACIESKKNLSVQRRLKSCTTCKACGMDCSHFANRVHREAGLDYPYASTRDMRRSSSRKLFEKYGLVEVGRDLRLAKPGDLILHPKHVVMLLALREGTRGDIVHVSRTVETGDLAGGVEIARDLDLLKGRGRVVKILRHARLWEGPLPQLSERSTDQSPTKVKKRDKKRTRPGKGQPLS